MPLDASLVPTQGHNAPFALVMTCFHQTTPKLVSSQSMYTLVPPKGD